MASYTIDEGAIFEKSGTSYLIEGIRFTTSFGEIYCAAGVISVDNCVDATGASVKTTDVTEAEAQAHLEWMASDFETRGIGVSDATVVEKLVAYTNKGPIIVPLTDATSTEVSTDESKQDAVHVDDVVSIVEEIYEKSEAAKEEAKS